MCCIQVLEHIDDMPPETAIAFGFHPNAAIGFNLRESTRFCAAMATLQPSALTTTENNVIDKQVKGSSSFITVLITNKTFRAFEVNNGQN